MRMILGVISVLVILAGGTFFLQGINVLPGSYMTDDPKWAVIGLMMLVFGALGCYFGFRPRPSTPQA